MKFRTLIFYAGLVAALAGLIFGSSCFRQYRVILPLHGKPTDLVATSCGKIYRMPFTVQLQKLYAQYYENGNIRQITAVLTCTYRQQPTRCVVKINHPAGFLYYQLYIQKYRLPDVRHTGHMELVIIRQPLQGLVYGGLGLMGLCALWQAIVLWIKQLKRQQIRVVSLAAIGIVGILLLFNPVIRQIAVPPILRSIWFIPHVIAYVLAYALLILSFVSSLRMMIRPSETRRQRMSCYLHSGTALFTVGLVLGIMWAKVAWGRFWSWDPKETLALITWVIYMGYIHVLKKCTPSAKINLMVQSIAFLSLLMCWFGIRWLPVGGLHTY